MSLKRRVLNAGAWSLAGLGAIQVIRFGTNLAMTRLLAPDTFGLMAISTVVMVGLALFSDLGLRPNIIRSERGEDPTFLNTAWVIQILRGILLWGVATAIAILLAIAARLGLSPDQSVYADGQLPYVLAALSVTAIISGFGTTKIFEASRKLALGRVTLLEVTAHVISTVPMFVWLLFDRSIWALVAGNIFGALASTVLGHAFLPGVANRWQWDPLAFKEILHFGKWLFLSSILGFLVINGDRLVLGGLANATFLGVYAIAFGIAAAIEQILVKIIASAAFPAISEIARLQPSRIKDTYYRMHILVAAIAYFSAGILMTGGQTLIRLLYDARYAESGWILEILSINLLMVPLQLATFTFLAIGKPWINSTISAARVILLFFGMPVGFYLFGPKGAICGLILSQLFSAPLIILFSIRMRIFAVRRELLVLPMLFVGLATGQIFVELARVLIP